ncbi:hypothetical protein V8F20_011595 [Naviculisporaceae sp. PSN 640]
MPTWFIPSKQQKGSTTIQCKTWAAAAFPIMGPIASRPPSDSGSSLQGQNSEESATKRPKLEEEHPSQPQPEPQPQPQPQPHSQPPSTETEPKPEEPSKTPAPSTTTTTTTIEQDWYSAHHSRSLELEDPTNVRSRYKVKTLHVPAEHHSFNRGLHTPWFGELFMYLDDLKLLSRIKNGLPHDAKYEVIFPTPLWNRLEKVEPEEYEKYTYVDWGRHWAFPERDDSEDGWYVRKVDISGVAKESSVHRTKGGKEVRWVRTFRWALFVKIWAEDRDWLAEELTLEKLRDLFNEETLVRTWAIINRDPENPLSHPKTFYSKYHHHDHHRNPSTASDQGDNQEEGAEEDIQEAEAEEVNQEAEAEAEEDIQVAKAKEDIQVTETDGITISLRLNDMEAEADLVEPSIAAYLESLEDPDDLVNEPEPGLIKAVEEHPGPYQFILGWY